MAAMQHTSLFIDSLDPSTLKHPAIFGDWREPSDVLQAVDGQGQTGDAHLSPLSPSLISFIALDASCMPHELEEAHWQRIGSAASCYHHCGDFKKKTYS
jgi:hypothetical protein